MLPRRISSSLTGLSLVAAAASIGGVSVTSSALEPSTNPDPPAPEVEMRATPLGYRVSVAQAMRETGTTSPSAAKRAKEKSIGRRLVYLPHVGAKQRTKALKRANAARAVELKREAGL